MSLVQIYDKDNTLLSEDDHVEVSESAFNIVGQGRVPFFELKTADGYLIVLSKQTVRGLAQNMMEAGA